MRLIPIVDYAEEFFRIPETGKKINLQPHQKKVLSLAFDFDPVTGKLPWHTILYSCPKKSGKSAIAGLVVSWFAFVMAEYNDEILICANDLEQAEGRVFKVFRQTVELEERLRTACSHVGQKSVRTNRGVEVKALSGDYAGAAGALFSLVTFDELWGFMSEKSHRLYEELTPIPTGEEIGRKNSIRFISTYAGWTGQSDLLEDLYNKGLEGECLDEELNIWINRQAGIFMYWDHKPRMPWHTPQYLEEQRNAPGMRLESYRRFFQNEWTSGEGGIDMAHWAACEDQALCEPFKWSEEMANQPGKNVYLSVGVDAAYKNDSAAVVSYFKKDGKLWLGPMKVWHPDPDNPLDLEDTMEAFILELHEKYTIVKLNYDPWQFARSAQTLWKEGIPVEEYTQSPNNLSEMAMNFCDLLKYRNMVIYRDENEDYRDQAMNVAIKDLPNGRGYRFDKAQKRKNDAIIAGAMAALAASEGPETEDSFTNPFTILRY